MKEGIDASKIEVIKLGIDLNKFKIQNSKLKSNSKFKKEFKILFTGRLVVEKGTLDLYEAFKNVQRVTRNAQRLKLLVVGEGPLKDILLSKIKYDKLDQFVTIVQKRYEEMPKIYHEADIFVLPSKSTKTWEEQYGMVLIEAMASGLPIIAYDTGAINEVVGNAGIYIHDGDVNGLAFAIQHLIEDKIFAKKLGTMGRERAESEYDCRKTARKIEELYKGLL